MKRVAAPLAAALLAVALALFGAACGGSGAEPGASNEATPATLILDFQPNAVHSGIYEALAKGDYGDAGVDLTVREPSSSTDAPKLLEAGKAQFALMDIHDLGLAAEKGFDLVGVAPIVQRPLASVLARADVDRPRDLEGNTVGVTGVPSDDAVLDSIVAGDGGDPSKIKRVTIGFNAVASLAAGKVSAATAFWNAEGVALKQQGVQINEFRVDQFGAPKYPELVLVTSRDTDPDLVEAMRNATIDGYKAAIDDPGGALDALIGHTDGLDRAEQQAQMDALTGADAFSPPGEFDTGALDAWAAWDAEHGILEQAPDTSKLFDVSH